MMRQPINCVAARDDRRQAVGQTLLERGDVVGDAAEDIALRVEVEIFLRHAVDLFRQLAAHPVGHFERDARHDIVLDEAEERAQPVDDGQQHADARHRGKVDAADQALGHERRDLTDLIRPDDGQHGAECRQHQRENDHAEALLQIDRQAAQRALEVRFFRWTHVGSHLDAPPFLQFFLAELRHGDLPVDGAGLPSARRACRARRSRRGRGRGSDPRGGWC